MDSREVEACGTSLFLLFFVTVQASGLGAASFIVGEFLRAY
jgi:hypothetical protein